MCRKNVLCGIKSIWGMIADSDSLWDDCLFWLLTQYRLIAIVFFRMILPSLPVNRNRRAYELSEMIAPPLLVLVLGETQHPLTHTLSPTTNQHQHNVNGFDDPTSEKYKLLCLHHCITNGKKLLTGNVITSQVRNLPPPLHDQIQHPTQ